MENETFKLLLIVNRDIIYELKRQDGETPYDRAVKEQLILNRLKLLESYGFVKFIGESKWTITEYGQEVSRHNNWKEYLQYIKEYNNKLSTKEKYDLRISWLQANTGWLPYLFSIIGIGISLFALSETNKNNNQEKYTPTHKETLSNQQKCTNSSTKNTLNEKVVDKDTFHLKNQNNEPMTSY